MHESTFQVFDEGLLREIRGRFDYVDHDPISGDRVWLESASGSLRLKAASDALFAQTRFPDQLGRANPSSQRAGEIMSQGIEDVKLFLGAQSGTIMPAMSSTHAVFRIVNAVLSAWPGNNVVTTNLEHPCVYDSTRRFSEIYRKQWRVVPVDPETGIVDTAKILDRVDRNTAMIGMIHGSNITGAVLDVKRVAQEARRINPEIVILADGVQYAPHAPVDVVDLGVDAYVFGPYKAFSVKGIGFAFLSERIAPLDHWKLKGSAATAWTLGSPEEATYGAWSAVTDYLCWLGSHFTGSSDRRTQLVAAGRASQQHLEGLRTMCLRGFDGVPGLLDQEHIDVCASEGGDFERLCLVLFNVAGMSSDAAVTSYNERRIRVHNRISDAYSKHTLAALGLTEGVRLSACHYNSPADIRAFLKATWTLRDHAGNEAAPPRRVSARGGPGEG